jgi:putative phage-type endonuclease
LSFTQTQRTPAWFEARKNRLTASQFGAALGLSPYQSRAALWRQLTGRSESFTGNEATAWGEEHEKDAVHAYEVATGRLVDAAHFIEYQDWSGCSPDGWVFDGDRRGILECKCPFSQKLHAAIPEHYLAQIHGQLGITGADFADYVCWTPDDLWIKRVWADQTIWPRMEVALKEFWQHVATDQEPKRARKFQL